MQLRSVFSVLVFSLPVCLAATADDPRQQALPGSEAWKVVKSTENSTTWLEKPGNYMIVTDHDGELTYPLDDVDALRSSVRKQAAKENGGLVEAVLVQRRGKTVGYFITKDVYKNLNGYRYVGRCVIPGDGGWREIRMESLPVGTTGMREAVLAARLNLYANMKMEPVPPQAPPTPGPAIKAKNGKPQERIQGWFFDPYDSRFDASANYTKTDRAEYDGMFPTHHLSRLRQRFPELLGIELQDSPADGKAESKLLKQAMVDVTVEVMKERVPNVEMNRVKSSIERAITAFRANDRDFLRTSTDDEARLAKGKTLDSSASRIKAAKAFLTEFDIQLAGPTVSLLEAHEQGKLSGVNTELLAHLLAAQVAQARKALEN
ncbi:MAG: hypothetical protein AAFU85_11985 [Planctomycetota bacterium]